VVAVPVLLILWTALFVDGALNTKDILNLEPARHLRGPQNSIVIATGVTFLSTIIGVFFAWLVSRTDLPFKETMKVSSSSLYAPSFIGALAWKMLLSPRSGFINKFLCRRLRL